MKFILFSLMVVMTVSTGFVGCSNKRVQPSVVAEPPAPGIHFVFADAFTPVMEMAAAENKLIFVDMYTDWCAPCKVMDREVFSDRNLGEFFDANFISYKVNAEKGNGGVLATVYSVQSFPTLLFLDADGKVLERANRSMTITGLRQMANDALNAASVGFVD